ncbi:MAG TPA: tripartite tricarboxylate transporter substrate binding protein [Burkholderiales bacterium]|nr:tripartite tricarboxylate transporter substrate binding protein [Burkholderiales bacterium]
MRFTAIAAALFCVAAASTDAQTYPTKPVRIIIPFAPGGPTDTQARWAAQQLNAALGQPFIADNRAGAGGVPGTEAAVKSAPDGYTLLAGNPGPLVIAPTVKAHLPYDTLRDLQPIVLIAKSPSCICVHPSLPVKGVKDFVALAKSRPGRINYGTPGVGTVGHLATESFATAAGIKMNHVPYKGAAQFTVDLIAGNIELAQIQLAGSAPLAKEGKVRCLGVTAIQRSPLLPDTPTIAEQGLKGFQSYNWNGLLAPVATPKPIIARIHEVIGNALKTPEAQKLYTSQGHEVSGIGPEEYAAFIKAETEKWADVAQRAGIPKQ